MSETVHYPSVIKGEGDVASPDFIVTGELSIATPLSVKSGGTGTDSMNAYGVVLGGTTLRGPLQSVSPGTSGTYLCSQGAGALPIWATPSSIISRSTTTFTLSENVFTSGGNWTLVWIRLGRLAQVRVYLTDVSGNASSSSTSDPFIYTTVDLPGAEWAATHSGSTYGWTRCAFETHDASQPVVYTTNDMAMSLEDYSSSTSEVYFCLRSLLYYLSAGVKSVTFATDTWFLAHPAPEIINYLCDGDS